MPLERETFLEELTSWQHSWNNKDRNHYGIGDFRFDFGLRTALATL